MSDSQERGEVVRASRFEARVSRALSRRSRDLLVAPDLPQQMAAFEPLEAYFLVKEIGVEDAAPLVKVASQEQLQAFVDLDCWEGDRFAPAELDAWLAPFAAEGPNALLTAFLKLDTEIQTLFLATSLSVYDLRSEETIPEAPQEAQRKSTPDECYLVEVQPNAEREVDPWRLLDAIYRKDMRLGFQLLTAVRWELSTNLEELAYQFRCGRIQDWGFLPREEALRIFAAPPRHASPPVVRGGSPATLPALYAMPMGEEALLTRALGIIFDPNLLDAIQLDLVHLVSRAIVAYRSRPGNLRGVTETAARVRDTVSLGIECAGWEAGRAVDSEGSVAAEILTQRTVLELFQVGHQETQKLQSTARQVARDPVIAKWLDRPDTEKADYGEDTADREFVAALLETPPLWAGWDPLDPPRRRAFATRGQIEAAAARLDLIVERSS